MHPTDWRPHHGRTPRRSQWERAARHGEGRAWARPAFRAVLPNARRKDQRFVARCHQQFVHFLYRQLQAPSSKKNQSVAARIGALSGEEPGHVALIEPRIPRNLRLGLSLQPPDPLTVLTSHSTVASAASKLIPQRILMMLSRAMEVASPDVGRSSGAASAGADWHERPAVGENARAQYSKVGCSSQPFWGLPMVCGLVKFVT